MSNIIEISDLSNRFNNLNIGPINKHKRIDIHLLTISMNKMRIGKKTKQKKIFNTNKLYFVRYDLFSLVNRKIFMNEIFGPILLKYFQKHDRIKMTPENKDDKE
jgi:hypothetical protein